MIRHFSIALNGGLFSGPQVAVHRSYADALLVRPVERFLLPGVERQLFRIGRSSAMDEENLSSSWWIDAHGVRMIESLAQRRRASAPISARARYETWHSDHVLYEVTLGCPIKAFAGRTRSIHPYGERALAIAAIEMFYIPGLRSPGGSRSAVARRALARWVKRPLAAGYFETGSTRAVAQQHASIDIARLTQW